jgi:hypothetical protein
MVRETLDANSAEVILDSIILGFIRPPSRVMTKLLASVAQSKFDAYGPTLPIWLREIGNILHLLHALNSIHLSKSRARGKRQRLRPNAPIESAPESLLRPIHTISAGALPIES